MKVLKQGDIVQYENEEHEITHVFNHGGNTVFYDLRALNPVTGTEYRKVELSVYHTEVKPLRESK